MMKMKKLFWVRLAVVMLLIPNAIAAQNQCSKSEIMTLISKGFDKSEIDEICHQESYCCCQIKTYKWTRECFLCDYSHQYAGKIYRWLPIRRCSNPSRQRDFRHRKKIVKRCTQASQCGRE